MSSTIVSSKLKTLDTEATLERLGKQPMIRWWQTTKFLEVHGPDTITTLEGLCTQAVDQIEFGTGKLGLFLDNKAKIIAPAILWRTADKDWDEPRTEVTHSSAERFLLEIPAHLIEGLHKHLKRYKLRAKMSLQEFDDCGAISITNPEKLKALPDTAQWYRSSVESVDTATYLGDKASIEAMIDRLGKMDDLPAADPDAWELYRIQNKNASLYDFVPGRMPAEVGGMEKAVSLEAGCYLGQEPVARLHYRGKSRRVLRHVTGNSAPKINADADLEFFDPEKPEGRALGQITTWAQHPDGANHALAVLRRELPQNSPLILGSTDETRTEWRVNDVSPDAEDG